MNNLNDYILKNLNSKKDHIKIESTENTDRQIISLIIKDKKNKTNKLSETTVFFSVDDSFDGDGISLSIYNIAPKQDNDDFISIANEINKNFKKTNVSFWKIPSNKVVFIINTSFYLYNSISQKYGFLLYAGDEPGEDKEINKKIEIEKYQKKEIEEDLIGILTEMRLALLQTSIEIDQKIINEMERSEP